jgi:hypothetical protein
MKKNKTLTISLQFVLWSTALITIAWLWDRWMLNGPHGLYRWVGMDFAPFWVGVRDMLHGINPYSPETTLKIQELVYGGPAALGEDPMTFSYPAWIFILIAPFSLIPYKWAVILYAGTLLWAMFNFLYKIASILENKNFLIQSLWLVLLILGSLPFLVISVTKGQLGYICLLALFVAYRIWKRHPLMAGIILGFALIKPTVTVIPVTGFLLWVLVQKNWKFLSGFTGIMAILFMTSYAAVGNWIPDYLGAVGSKVSTTILWSIEILSLPWNILYASIFIIIGIFSFYYSFTKKEYDYWFSAIILLGIAVTPMRWIYDLFLGILLIAEKRNFSRLQSFTVSIAIISPWVLVFIPETTRWNAAVIGLPLIWAATLLMLIFTEN